MNYTLTIALTDDTGATGDATALLRTLRILARNAGATIYSEATGEGIDTATGATEPIVILQGDGSPDAVATLGRNASTVARTALNHRAIGWFATTEDTYRLTDS